MIARRPFVVLTEPYSDSALEKLRQHVEVVAVAHSDRAALLAAMKQAHGLLVRTYTLVDVELLNAAPQLRVIGRAGVGLDNIDVASAQARGIKIVHTPAASTLAVAELTIGLIIALERHIVAGHSAVHADEFHDARKRLVGRELRGLTLGIIGLGRIGKSVARIAHHGLGMRVVYNDIAEMGWLDFVAVSMEKSDLFRVADVISLHVPLTSLTRQFVNAGALASLKSTATLINTSRGPVVDGLALAKAIDSGQLAGAALDVFDPEPLPPDHPLLQCDRVLLTPHLASRTRESMARMECVIDEVIRELAKMESSLR